MTVEQWLGKDNKIGIDIWYKKYRNADETFEQWVSRVSGGNDDVARLIREKKFLFGGRILASRGLASESKKVTYSNCYVTPPPEDNLESIFECAGKLARTFSYGGGCGVDISKLAPKGATVHNAAKASSGSVSFMDLYSLVTELIGQSGRRGALMISLDCTHPDLEDFITLKSDLNKVTKANISIKATDEFMQAVKDDKEFKLSFTREETGEVICKTVRAKELFMKIAKINCDYGEPGILFWDKIRKWNLLSETKSFSFAGVNPCAEEPLPAGGSCLLGSLNLAQFVRGKQFDWCEFENAVIVAVTALNEVLDEGIPLHPLLEQRDSASIWRQIGLGVMGIADMLIKMEIEYGSPESFDICGSIANVMINAAMRASANLAGRLGRYPAYDADAVRASKFYKENVWDITDDAVRMHGLRNSQLLTIAPTGTISTMLGISGGIEPIYANSYTRKTESLHGTDVYYKVYTPVVEQYMKEHNIENESDLPRWFVTAQNIPYQKRIQMQATWQQYIDASISSTINVPNDFTAEQVADLYMTAWENGLKGVTVFRDGCKRAGILSAESHSKRAPESVLNRGDIVKISTRAIGRERHLITGCGTLHCTSFFDPDTGDLLETYLSKGSTGGCNNFMIGLSRMISLAARSGCNINHIVDQLSSCGICPSYAVRNATKKDTSKGSCCPVAIGNALLEMYDEIQQEINAGNSGKKSEAKQKKNNPCPQCGEELIFEGGCNICKSCGWSKCI